MNKREIIEKLHSLSLDNITDDENRQIFEPVILAKPEIGMEALISWMSQYYVSFNSKSYIEYYIADPNWANFTRAANSLMLDRIISAVAMDGNVSSRVKDCIELTLKKDGTLDRETLFWIEYYSGTNCLNKEAA